MASMTELSYFQMESEDANFTETFESTYVDAGVPEHVEDQPISPTNAGSEENHLISFNIKDVAVLKDALRQKEEVSSMKKVYAKFQESLKYPFPIFLTADNSVLCFVSNIDCMTHTVLPMIKSKVLICAEDDKANVMTHYIFHHLYHHNDDSGIDVRFFMNKVEKDVFYIKIAWNPSTVVDSLDVQSLRRFGYLFSKTNATRAGGVRNNPYALMKWLTFEGDGSQQIESSKGGPNSTQEVSDPIELKPVQFALLVTKNTFHITFCTPRVVALAISNTLFYSYLRSKILAGCEFVYRNAPKWFNWTCNYPYFEKAAPSFFVVSEMMCKVWAIIWPSRKTRLQRKYRLTESFEQVKSISEGVIHTALGDYKWLTIIPFLLIFSVIVKIVQIEHCFPFSITSYLWREFWTAMVSSIIAQLLTWFILRIPSILPGKLRNMPMINCLYTASAIKQVFILSAAVALIYRGHTISTGIFLGLLLYTYLFKLHKAAENKALRLEFFFKQMNTKLSSNEGYETSDFHISTEISHHCMGRCYWLMFDTGYTVGNNMPSFIGIDELVDSVDRAKAIGCLRPNLNVCFMRTKNNAYLHLEVSSIQRDTKEDRYSEPLLDTLKILRMYDSTLMIGGYDSKNK